jgi:hypothetical protein
VPQDYYVGGNGVGMLNGTDYNITDCNMTVTTDLAEITNTSHYDPTDKVTYKDQIVASRQGSGTINFHFDGNNPPLADLHDPAGMTTIIHFAANKLVYNGAIDLENYAVAKNGMGGVVGFNCSFRTKGKFALGTYTPPGP